MKNSAASIRIRLNNLAKKENIDFQIILIRYLHERFLYRLSNSSSSHNFFLKGGTLLYAIEGIKTRPTIDIDFLAVQIPNEIDVIKNTFVEICKIQFTDDGVWFESNSISAEIITENNKYNGVRIYIQSGFDTIRQRLQIDIGFGDVFITKPQQLHFPVLLNEMQVPVINAYSLETVIAEKFHAMIELSTINSRMKDFYDVYKLILQGDFDNDILQKSIIATFKNRNTNYIKDHALFTDEFSNSPNRQKAWNSFLNKINIQQKIPFHEIMITLKEILYPIWVKIEYVLVP